MGELTSLEYNLLIIFLRCTAKINNDKYKLPQMNLINLLLLHLVFQTYSYGLTQ